MTLSGLDRLRWLLITGFGSGLAPVASGTFGTLPAVAIGIVITTFAGGWSAVWLWPLSLGLLAFGCAQSTFTERVFPKHDPGQFVLDEIVGYLIAVALFTTFLGPLSPTGHAVCFLAFRFFDVTKIAPADRLEELPGALGIMLDDVAAGVYAGLVTLGLARLGLF